MRRWAAVLVASGVLSSGLAIAHECGKDSYDRKDYKHWVDVDGDCQNTRHEVLIAHSEVPVVLSDDGCRVVSGLWVGPYNGKEYTDPKDLDVDHLVPLANAHASGACQWPAEQRELYANYMDDPRHLLPVDKRLNRQKGKKGPEEWLPPLSRCRYISDWMNVKEQWGLSLTTAEAKAICSELASCPNVTVSCGGFWDDRASGLE